MAYDAVGVSGRDLTAGPEFLLEMQSRARFSWLSANLIDSQTGSPLFKPYLEMKAGQVRVAIVGLTDPTSGPGEKFGATYKILEWPAVLGSIIADLRSRSDFIILLTDYNQESCREIAAATPEIKLIIPALSINNHPPELLTDSTLLAQTGNQGKYLGVLTVSPRLSGKWDRGEKAVLAQKKNMLERLNWQAERFRDRPESQGRYRQLLKKIEQLEQESRELTTKQGGRSEPVERSTFAGQFVALGPDLPDDQEVMAVVVRAKQQIVESGHQAQPSPPGANN